MENVQNYSRSGDPDMQTPLDLCCNWDSDQVSTTSFKQTKPSPLHIIHTNILHYQTNLDKIWEFTYMNSLTALK